MARVCSLSAMYLAEQLCLCNCTGMTRVSCIFATRVKLVPAQLQDVFCRGGGGASHAIHISGSTC